MKDDSGSGARQAAAAVACPPTMRDIDLAPLDLFDDAAAGTTAAAIAPRELHVVRLGRMGYADALELQRRVAKSRITGRLSQDLLLLVEHPPVITLGRSAKAHNLVTSADMLAERGVELHEVERGGDVTFHGPGQLVGYGIVDLKRHLQDLHWYLRQVEEVMITALGTLGVRAGRYPTFTGVWTGEGAGEAWQPTRKIASIGVHARDWVTWHGFALNVTTDLRYFDLMVPCGIPGVDMTSVARELRREQGDALPDEGSFAERMQDERALEARVGIEVAAAFGRVFALAPIDVDAGTLDLEPVVAG